MTFSNTFKSISRAGVVAAFALFSVSCLWHGDNGGNTMSVYTGGYPVADYGPNDAESWMYPTSLGMPAGPASPPTNYYYSNGKITDNGDGTADVQFRQTEMILPEPPGGNPVQIPSWLKFDASAEVSKMRMVDLPTDLGTITAIKVRVVSISAGFTAGGDLSFPVTVYKGDGSTVIGTGNLTVARNSRTNPLGTEGEDHTTGDLDEIEFTSLTVSESDVGAGLVLKLDSTDAGAGWGTGTPEWDVQAVDLVITYTSDTVFESITEVESPIRPVAYLYSDNTDCALDTAINDTVELTTLIID